MASSSRRPYPIFIFPGSQQGSLINEVGQVRSHEAWGAAGDLSEIHIGT